MEQTLTMAKEVFRRLKERQELVVFAESCTAGAICALFAQVPGVSDVLCGSFVTYQANSKRFWLNVSSETIDQFTCESPQVAAEMARNVLYEATEATWSVAIVGHLGPNAGEKDGHIWVSVARYVDHEPGLGEEVIFSSNYVLRSNDRIARQREAAEFALTQLARHLVAADKE